MARKMLRNVEKRGAQAARNGPSLPPTPAGGPVAKAEISTVDYLEVDIDRSSRHDACGRRRRAGQASTARTSLYYPRQEKSKDHHKRVTTENPARPSCNRMTARVNDERRNFGASYNFRVHQALGNLRTPRRFWTLVERNDTERGS